MIHEQVRITVNTESFHGKRNLAKKTTISTEFGDWQSVDDEVTDFVLCEFQNFPSEIIKKISWNYV